MSVVPRFLLLIALSGPRLQAAPAPKIVIVLHTEGAMAPAATAFLHKFGAQAARIVIAGERNAGPEIPDAAVLFMEHPTPEFLQANRQAAAAAMKRGMIVLTDVAEVLQRQWEFTPNPGRNAKALAYFQLGGAENLTRFLMVLYEAAGAPLAMNIPPPAPRESMGVYHPRAGRFFPNLKEYLAWYRKAMPSQGKLAMVTFYQSSIRDRELQTVNALIAELEKQGLAAAGVFGWPYSTIGPVLEAPPDDPIAVNLCFTLTLSRPEDAVALGKLGVHVISLMTSNVSYEEWAKSDRGVTPERMAFSIASPERNGATEPIMVATEEPDPNTGIYHVVPIAERVEMAVRRARRWIALEEKANAQKHLAILYYNNPPGKGNIGASYLNLPPSILAVLQELRREGYNTGEAIPTADELLAQLELTGRNIELWAPGELERLVEKGGVTLIPMDRYRQWFDKLPKQFRDFVNASWGPPEASKLMTVTLRDGKKLFVIPGLRFGNIFLGPQLLRASTEAITSAQHSGALPPPHAYIASYLYYRHQFEADAVIHMGRHGTLEWLPGKNAGQAGWDSSEVLLGDLPNLNYYIMDGGGEDLQARRHSAAVLISHLTPMIASGGAQERFEPLAKAIDNWSNTHDTSPELAAQYRDEIFAEALRLHLDTQLALPVSGSDDSAIKKLSEFLDASEEAPIPLGLPILGQAPPEDRQREGLLKLIRSAFTEGELRLVASQLPAWSSAVFEGRAATISDSVRAELREKIGKTLVEASAWLENLKISPERELTAMIEVLRGQFLPSGLDGDPLRTPAALPSGRDLHATDPATYPTKEAWMVGKHMGDEMIARFRKEHGGAWPERVSMVLWSGETNRHQGAMEAEAMYLMGVEPEWNIRGAVDRLKLIPDGELGRPRVSVLFTASGLYRDSLPDKMLLLDRAARMAAAAGDNALSRQNHEVEKVLVAGGIAPEEAAHLAGARVFSEAPGAFGNGLSNMVELNGEKGQAHAMADLYLAKTNYVYTDKVWGGSTPKLLAAHLAGNQIIVHSRSSNLYGVADNDDVYQAVGGLDNASRSVGAAPQILFNNLRAPGHEHIEDAKEALATELNSRNWNPKWIEGMKTAGYSGARVMANNVEYLYGWQATSPDNVDPSVWKKTYDVYVADEYQLNLPKFLSETNPFAQQKMGARLLDIHRQGIYRFSKQEEALLLTAYVQSVSKLGVACSAVVCGNRRLQSFVLQRSREVSPVQMSRSDLNGFRQQLERATQSAFALPSAAKTQRLSKPDNSWLKRVTFIDFNQSPREFLEHPFGLDWSFWLISWVLGGLYPLYRKRTRMWSSTSVVGPSEVDSVER